MSIYLGNLSVEQIEKRTGITLTDEHREYMKKHRQEAVNDTPLEVGAWHCSLEEMAKFIAEHDKNCDIADAKYCLEICDQRVKGRCKHDECVRLYMTEEECVREWLKAERNEE